MVAVGNSRVPETRHPALKECGSGDYSCTVCGRWFRIDEFRKALVGTKESSHMQVAMPPIRTWGGLIEGAEKGRMRS